MLWAPSAPAYFSLGAAILGHACPLPTTSPFSPQTAPSIKDLWGLWSLGQAGVARKIGLLWDPFSTRLWSWTQGARKLGLRQDLEMDTLCLGVEFPPLPASLFALEEEKTSPTTLRRIQGIRGALQTPTASCVRSWSLQVPGISLPEDLWLSVWESHA